nr:zinc finger, CCHC-type [Tanacetum cinerariifolium]
MKFMEHPTRPAPDPETADPDTIDKYYKTVNPEQESRLNRYCLKQSKYSTLVNRRKVSLMGKMIAELNAMLKLHEKGIPKKAEIPAMLAIREGKIQKDKRKPRGAKGKDKGNNKLAYAPKPKISPPPKIDNMVKDSIYHHCKKVGHWRRNYPSYQAELKKRKNASMATTSSIFTIELYAFPNKTWNYVPWLSRLLRYAKSRPNEKLIHNSILNGPYVRRMIPEPGDAERDVNVNETFHEQTDDELSERELKQIEADDQAIQTILLGLP